MSRFSNVLLPLAVGLATLGVTQSALAGEIKLFAEAPEVDGSGKLVGSPKSIKELASAPGDDVWTLHLWAKIDKGAPGPLYAECYGDLNGKSYLAQNFEKSDYEGEKYVNWEIELDGNTGFNRDRTYKIQLMQIGTNEKKIPFGSASVKLLYTEADKGAEEGDGEAGGGGSGGDDDNADQDAIDSFAEGGGGADGDAPPPVAPPAKKGCSVGATSTTSAALLLMLVLGAGVRRRS